MVNFMVKKEDILFSLIILLIILTIVVIVIITGSIKNKNIKKYSPYYLKALEINNTYSFKKITNKYDKKSYILNSKKQFDNFNYSKKCSEYINEYLNEFLNIVNSIEYNKAYYKDYLSEFNSIPKTNDSNLADKYHMSLKEFNKREIRLAKKLLITPNTDYLITLSASYTSPKGKNSYTSSETFNYDFIKEVINNVSPKEIFDTELVEEKNKRFGGLERLD